jgi:hypothetical protein
LRRLLAAIRHGRGLRHVPVAVRETDARSVRVELHGDGELVQDITHDHALISLRPLIVGIHVGAERGAAARCTLVMLDDASGAALGEVSLEAVGEIPLGSGRLVLFRTTRCVDRTASRRVRWWRYHLAAVHARRASAREDELQMSAADLRCLNVFYMVPRRVHLLGVSSATELFTSSLVDRLSSGEVLLSLPATSPEIAHIEGSRTVAISAAPAERWREVLELGAYARAPNGGREPALAVRRSRLHGLPVLVDGFSRELTVLATHRVGSHVLLGCRVDGEEGTPPRQLAYLSQMYVEWSTRKGREVDVLD